MNEPVQDPAPGADPRVAALEQSLFVVKREVDALQIEAARKSAAWYQTPSVILSFLALLFSFGTTFVSYRRTLQQDVHDARAELRALIQRLNALPKESVQAAEAYAAKPGYVGAIQSLINGENALVAKQAVEVLQRIPEQVSATEYLSIAYAMTNSGLLDRSEELTKTAMARARDYNDDVAGHRQMAGLLFAAGKRDEGRREYESSFEAAKRYPLTNAAYVAYTDAQTQLAWAQAEAQYGEAERAREHLAKGQKYAATLPSTAWNDALKQQFALLSQQLGG